MVGSHDCFVFQGPPSRAPCPGAAFWKVNFKGDLMCASFLDASIERLPVSESTAPPLTCIYSSLPRLPLKFSFRILDSVFL